MKFYTEIFYKIRRKSDGKFKCSGVNDYFCEDGSEWSKLGAAKNILTRSKDYKEAPRYNYHTKSYFEQNKKFPDCEIVVFEREIFEKEISIIK